MHTLLGVVVVASLAFVGSMFDNFFTFAAQLVVTDRAKYRRVSWAQGAGVATLVALAAGVGSALSPIPLALVGLLSVVLFALGVHAWRQRRQPRAEPYRRGAVTTFTMTLALGGDNLAVWIPLLRANGLAHAFVIVATFALWEVVFLASAQWMTRRPLVVTWSTRHAPAIVPAVYFALGVLTLFECGIL